MYANRVEFDTIEIVRESQDIEEQRKGALS